MLLAPNSYKRISMNNLDIENHLKDRLALQICMLLIHWHYDSLAYL